MIISEIRSDILAIEVNKSIYKKINFNLRADALDFIDFQIIDRIESIPPNEDLKEELDWLRIRSNNLKYELEQIDSNLFLQIRKKIRTVNDKRLFFKKTIFKYLGIRISDIEQSPKIRYDNLDIFINGLICDKIISEPKKIREVEMVFYQKTPARVIFEMLTLARLKQDDVFFDLGSGLGQVAILVNIVSGISAYGIEYEPTYCEYANECALRLNLSNVRFINADARNSDYSKGTIFFLYTPFEGNMLLKTMEILHKVAQKRVIKIFTYGPCSITIEHLDWLNCVTGEVDNAYKLYEFRSLLAENV